MVRGIQVSDVDVVDIENLTKVLEGTLEESIDIV